MSSFESFQFSSFVTRDSSLVNHFFDNFEPQVFFYSINYFDLAWKRSANIVEKMSKLRSGKVFSKDKDLPAAANATRNPVRRPPKQPLARVKEEYGI